MKPLYIILGAVAIGAAWYLWKGGPSVVGAPTLFRTPTPATGPAVETKSGRGHF